MKEGGIEDQCINNSFQEHILQKQRETEENVLRQVLTKFLGHEPTEQDAKKCYMGYRYGIHDRYSLSYDTFPLGIVKRSYEDGRYVVTFAPCVEGLNI